VITTWPQILAVGAVTILWAGQPRNRGSVLGRAKIFISS